MYSLKHLYFKGLDLWGQSATIHVHQHLLEELKGEFKLLGIAEVECVDEPKQHGKSIGNTSQFRQKFQALNHYCNIGWLVLIIKTLFLDHIKPYGGLCDASLGFFKVEVLMVKNKLSILKYTY